MLLRTRLLPLLSLIAGLAVLTVGCASLETNTYRTLGTTATLVDGAMNGWGDWVRAGRATAADETAVLRTYEVYQATMLTARTAILSYKSNPDTNRAQLLRALDSLEASSDALIALIARLTMNH